MIKQTCLSISQFIRVCQFKIGMEWNRYRIVEEREEKSYRYMVEIGIQMNQFMNKYERTEELYYTRGFS